MLKKTIILLGVATTLVTTVSAEARSFYTDNAVSGARANASAFDWARKEKEEILGYADVWLKMSDEDVWNFLSEQSVPRAIFASQPPKCPIHGSLEAHGDYAWKVLPEYRWKVQCPIGGERWPTNDFEAYYRSGKDGANVFRAGNANRSLLYSTDSSRNYGVDDGSGYVHSDGTRSYFVAYYAYWGIWHQVARSDSNAVTVLSKAYLLTGKPEYAHKALLLIARAADLYRAMNVREWTSQGIPSNDGYTGMGKILGKIWDDEIANNLLMAWDAVSPALGTDAALQRFLADKSSRHGLTPQANADQISAHIEDNLLAAVMDAVEEGHIHSNEGRAQRTYAMAAALLGKEALEAAMDWLNAPGEDGGHLPELFWSLVDRDGAGTEGSPYYNAVWLEALMPLASVLGMAGDGNLFATYPHLEKLLLYPGRLMNLGRYYPHVGDAGMTGGAEMPMPDLVSRYVRAFHEFGSVRAALLAYHLNGNTEKGLHGGLFGGDAKEIESKVRSLVNANGPIWTRSDNMPGYGLAMHRAGTGDASRSMWLYHGRTGHGGNHPHADRLNLGLFAYGLDLLPDLGYPEYAIAWPTTQGWIRNTVAHNTVVVDGRRQNESYTGDQRIFLDTPRVQFSEVDGGDIYPQTSQYRRSVAMIQIDNARSYVVDLFRVRGGGEHVYSFHAAEGDVATEGLELQGRSGTYAGPSIGFGEFYDEAFSGSYAGSGYQFLDHVETAANRPETFSADWKVRDTHNQAPEAAKDKVGLRMTMLGNQGEVSFANGYPAQNIEGNPDSLRYMLVRNQGSDLASRFVGVIEPYLENPMVEASELMPLADEGGDAVALRIRLKNGRTDYVFSSTDDAEHKTADGAFTFSGPFAVHAEMSEGTAFTVLADGGVLKKGKQVLAQGESPTGTVVDVAYTKGDESRVTVTGRIPDDGSFVNRWIDFRSATGHDANFFVTDVKPEGENTVLTLSGADPVVGLQDAARPESGYKLAIERGAEYRFPAVVYERGPAYDELDTEMQPVHNEITGDLQTAAASETSDAGGCASGGMQLPYLLLLAALPLLRRMRSR